MIFIRRKKGRDVPYDFVEGGSHKFPKEYRSNKSEEGEERDPF